MREKYNLKDVSLIRVETFDVNGRIRRRVIATLANLDQVTAEESGPFRFNGKSQDVDAVVSRNLLFALETILYTFDFEGSK